MHTNRIQPMQDDLIRVKSRGGGLMRRIGFLAALLAVAVLVLGGAGTGSAKPQPAGAPDAYVASWDATGTQAFSAAGLTPAEGHVIFAYVAIAVYDAVMAVDGGYEPFANDVDAPDDASAEAAVVAAAYSILAHYLPGQRQRSSTRREPRRSARSPTARRRPPAWQSVRVSRAS